MINVCPLCVQCSRLWYLLYQFIPLEVSQIPRERIFIMMLLESGMVSFAVAFHRYPMVEAYVQEQRAVPQWSRMLDVHKQFWQTTAPHSHEQAAAQDLDQNSWTASLLSSFPHERFVSRHVKFILTKRSLQVIVSLCTRNHK